MGLMISSIAKIGNSIMPKNLFKKNSDYYLYILEYSDLDIKGDPDYSGNLYESGMSKVLNNYQYDFENRSFEKLNSKTFHSTNVMSYQNIFDIENLNSKETRPAKITPAFLFTTIQPDFLNKIHSDNIYSEEFIFLKINPQDRDANKIPQLVNEMLSSTGLTVSRCKQSSVESDYQNVFIFDYCPETPTTKVPQIENQFNLFMKDNINVGNIIGNSGLITVGKDNETKVNVNDELGKKSYNWQKWGIITGTILAIIAIIATISYS
jgi:hypothetical protein